MSNNNYITIQLSFLSYNLFVFTRFEAFSRNAVHDISAKAIKTTKNRRVIAPIQNEFCINITLAS